MKRAEGAETQMEEAKTARLTDPSSIHPSIHPSAVHPCICPSIHPFVHRPSIICLCIYLSVDSSTHLSIHPSSIHSSPSTHPSACLSVHPSTCLRLTNIPSSWTLIRCGGAQRLFFFPHPASRSGSIIFY